MPNRILKESICTSESLDALFSTPEVERLFYRIIVNCDDYGRMEASPKIIRAKCFPLRADEINSEQVRAWLEGLSPEHITLYVVDGHKYLQIVKWSKHQQIRAKRSKYPEPPPVSIPLSIPLSIPIPPVLTPDLQADASNCKQTLAYVPVSGSGIVIENRNREAEAEAGSNTEPTTAAAALKKLLERFEQNIQTITPTVRETLAGWFDEYGEDELSRALDEAVTYNKKNLAYVHAVLKGSHGNGHRNSDDPDKFVKGKYGHMVQR